MTYLLAIGERAYSSWSLRGWLAFAAFGVEVETVLAPMDDPRFAETLAGFAPARTVPALRIEGVGVIWDTLAIAETLVERHPEVAFWPADPARRGLARALAAEMHSGFAALRGACPMDLRCAYAGFEAGAAVRADLARIETLWATGRAAAGEGPWLLGAYSLADVFHAPVAARIAAYGLPVGAAARDYVAAHLAHPAFLAWRAEALRDPRRLPTAGAGHAELPWPGPGA
ncbi:glutathione S-transferase [Amaricoccus sp.]|uniref:glutathione S-transferase n=1 Tax=Amaricoccus sp. TaxID=1872485 RepID=UPI001B6C74F8|nr:glutathione S-transferase [Amaricoccus sp.]MBP7243001.1 glutathione S-transferase [Amaricoccus sp.]